jgi:hypothetical protein
MKTIFYSMHRKLFKLNFDVKVSIIVNVKYFYKQDKNNELNSSSLSKDVEIEKLVGNLNQSQEIIESLKLNNESKIVNLNNTF